MFADRAGFSQETLHLTLVEIPDMLLDLETIMPLTDRVWLAAALSGPHRIAGVEYVAVVAYLETLPAPVIQPSVCSSYCPHH